ncbi:MAG TPA: hypothetical protein VJ485_03420, partial [archaeon]|nr:hypothetical protein [archaeon]
LQSKNIFINPNVDYLPSAKKTALDIIGLLAVNTNSVFLAQRLKLSQKHLRSSSILKYAALSMRAMARRRFEPEGVC